ncbi:MAG: 2-phosphosulfolactate phosphatase [Clostridiales bacterium]|nr:2-phosphosulfolactate phosphatase [Clostridiales bacterium]
MDIKIYQLIEGAKRAEGLAVIIDVFRAFSLECCLFAAGVKEIYPIGDLETAFAMKKADPGFLLFGERGGAKVEGCDYGNSPSSIKGADLSGRTVIHTTSAGTQGIAGASGADEVITGSFLNAEAVAAYIKKRSPEKVSLCAMGKAGLSPAREDVLCAEYIRSLVLGKDYPADEMLRSLRHNGGEHFFDPGTQDVYPEADFHICARRGVYRFVIRCEKDGAGRTVNRMRGESEW